MTIIKAQNGVNLKLNKDTTFTLSIEGKGTLIFTRDEMVALKEIFNKEGKRIVINCMPTFE